MQSRELSGNPPNFASSVNCDMSDRPATYPVSGHTFMSNFARVSCTNLLWAVGRIDVVDESTVLFPRSFLLIQKFIQAAQKILPGFVHILIVYHAVRKIIRKSTKLCFIFTSKLLYERSITHVSSTRSHFYIKFRLMYLVPICWAVGFSVIVLTAW